MSPANIAEFAQVGNDTKAQQFLETLDNHPVVGNLVDCTSNFESEQAEMMRKTGIERESTLGSAAARKGSGRAVGMEDVTTSALPPPCLRPPRPKIALTDLSHP